MMKTIISICTILAFAFGAFFYFEKNFAKAQDVQKIEKRLDYKIISDQVDRKKAEIREIKKKYPDQAKMPESVKEDFEQLQKEQTKLERRIENLENVK